MADESYFRNTFHSEITNLIQAHVIQMRAPEPPKPMEVPSPPRHWVDREKHLEEIRRHLTGDDTSPLVVHGPAGSGKSALAARIATQMTEFYPDGQIYIDLDADDMLSATRSALLRLGIAKDQLSDSFGGLLAHFRSVTRDKTVLVVVDGADNAAEGLHFRPGSVLSGLLVFALNAAPDPSVRHMALDDLGIEDAARLLLKLSADGGSASPELPWSDLLREYGTRPSAIRRLAGLIRARKLTERGDYGEILTDLLEFPTRDLLESTYRTLSESAAWLYRLLSVLPSAEFENSILKIFDSQGTSSASAFQELVNAQLVTTSRPGWYLVEPSISRDAARRAQGTMLPVELVSAMRSSLRWYLKRAQLADRAVMGDRLRRAPVPEDVECPGFDDAAEALTWLQSNHTSLAAAVGMAAFHGWHDEAWGLAEAMWALYNNVAYPDEARRCYQTAVESTKKPVDRARMLLFLGRVQLDLAEYASAEDSLHSARNIALAVGDRELEGSAVELLGRAKHWQGHYDEAIALYEQALFNALEGGRSRAEGIQLMYLGRAHRDAGRPERAVEYLAQALDVFVRIEDGRHVLLVETDLAVLKAGLGVPGAEDEADEAIMWLRRAGLARHEAEAQERLAEGFHGEDRRRRLEAALEVYERISTAEARRVRRLLG
ncbi:tetratricopeptide repeat protein [Glycomyces artemisiae]|uniref:Tetratricopeptide repeat protein n=1 Tax=Glycomyces artemisiae TaxID=1076443 RepID=A0A2T0USS1_9ACTN|nr:tetratricopeptide repeat protein [Glycomyces artemisiae]PRY60981.1 tetratricopeptide repeat protein [Glycomyces artemisiae]